MFKPNDVVETINSEFDIELIPAGTKISLNKPNGSDFWYGYGEINGIERILLVCTNNLRKVSD